MRIHADKTDGNPPHGLTVRDVRVILAAVPSEWITGLVEVRLANGMGPRAYLFHSEGRLTIYSRHGTKKQVLVEVLCVLAAPFHQIESTVARSPSKEQKHRLEASVGPLVDQLLLAMTPSTKRSPAAHVPWIPAPFPNDVA